jgi:hypothetical protein
MDKSEKVTEYINKGSDDEIQILEFLRHLIHQTVPGTSEDIKWGIPVFTKTKAFTYLRTTKQHIALGFYNIDQGKDPGNLLTGTGKRMKHLKIKKLEDIDSIQIADWLKVTVEELKS